jgi:hypothetical protein
MVMRRSGEARRERRWKFCLLVCLLACCLYCVYKHLEALVPGRVRERVNTINSFFSQQSHLHRCRLLRMQPQRQSSVIRTLTAKGVFNLAENGTIYGYQNMGVYFSF